MAPKQENDRTAHLIDAYVGGRMRLRRVQLGMSQGVLANRVGVSFQAVQKYEAGDIRISASRLYDVATVLGVSPGFFFEGYPDGIAISTLADEAAAACADANGGGGGDPFDHREIMSLIRGYYGIRDRAVRNDLLRLISRLGSRTEADGGDAPASS
jgi:transcriptional regulator with XRE-family HTH domain